MDPDILDLQGILDLEMRIRYKKMGVGVGVGVVGDSFKIVVLSPCFGRSRSKNFSPFTMF